MPRNSDPEVMGLSLFLHPVRVEVDLVFHVEIVQPLLQHEGLRLGHRISRIFGRLNQEFLHLLERHVVADGLPNPDMVTQR